MPSLDVRSEPEARTSWTEIEDWTRHLLVSPLVLADCVSVAQTEDLGYCVRINQVIEHDSSRHAASLRRLADVSYGRNLSVRPAK